MTLDDCSPDERYAIIRDKDDPRKITFVLFWRDEHGQEHQAEGHVDSGSLPRAMQECGRVLQKRFRTFAAAANGRS